MYKAEFAKMIESEVALIFFITQERQDKSIKREFNVVNESNSPQLCRYNENLRASFPDCILDTPDTGKFIKIPPRASDVFLSLEYLATCKRKRKYTGGEHETEGKGMEGSNYGE